MKAQQHAIYESLKRFMHAIGHAFEHDQREDDPIWSTKNDNDFKSMMHHIFGVEPHKVEVPTKLDQVHAGIVNHPEWKYLDEHEHDDGLEAPAAAEAAPAPVAPAPTQAPAPAPTPAPTAPPAPAVEAPAPAPVAPEVAAEIKKDFEAEKAAETTAPATAEQQPQQEQPAQEGGSKQE